MKKTIVAFAFCALLFAFCGCKKQNKETALLQQLVEQINANADTELPNGTILNKCEYAAGDTLFTYYITVEDNRYDNVEADSIKSAIGRGLHEDGMKKISTILHKNNIGLRYIYNTSAKEIEIVFTPEELSNE